MSHPPEDKSPEVNIELPPNHFQQIYKSRAAEYHRMISAEDIDGNLLPALLEITSFFGKEVLDVGSGTGRIPLLIQDHCKRLDTFDISINMLEENYQQRLKITGRWEIFQADMVSIPLASNCYDVVIAGWAIGHQRFWHQSDWESMIDGVLSEIFRVLRADGVAIILETLGTGSNSPAPPVQELSQYYTLLEERYGFERTTIQTDYQFTNLEEAVQETEFFFGKDLSQQIIDNQWSRLPEWTGIWSFGINST